MVLVAVQLPSQQDGTRHKYYYQQICEEEIRLPLNWLGSCDFPVIFPSSEKSHLDLCILNRARLGPPPPRSF